ncbi:MAG: sporulation protein YabP [Oscillospiraceae bacterium]|nr:sporulation protein YabP [Oscillospiraceae bacterium]
MAYDTQYLQEQTHRLTLDNRQQLTVSGVEEVESFDEGGIIMVTGQGTLVVRGSGLHIEQLSLDGGQLRVEGQVESLTYEDMGNRGGGGFLSRLLR